MGYTTGCIINKKYDANLIKELKVLGYNIEDFNGDEKSCNYIMTMRYYNFITFGWSNKFAEDVIRNGIIDCGTNEQLFLAIAALRDDSDIYQWFTDGDKWVKSDIHELSDLKEYFDEVKFDYSKTHKATVIELIEKFK